MPIFGGEKPFTSVTVKVNQLCMPNRNSDLDDDSMEVYLDQLISLIKLQSTGASEAARAIRKKIKYGNSPEEMLRALNLLELLMLNAGPKIGPVIAQDDKLVELLRGVVSGNATTGAGAVYNGMVVRRFRNLAMGWKSEFNGLDGYKPLASLWKSVPQKAKSRTRPQESVESEYLDHTDSNRRAPAPPRPKTTSPYTVQQQSQTFAEKSQKANQHRGFLGKRSEKPRKGLRIGKYADEKYKIPQINYKVEAPKIRETIANCHTHTTALDNILLTLPETESPLDNERAAAEFEKCRKIRHRVLRYLQFVGAGQITNKSSEVAKLDEEFLGALIVANDQLVSLFTKFDRLCGYTDGNPAAYHDESDSSGESYYSESDDESVTEQLHQLHVQESSLRQARALHLSPQADATPEPDSTPEPESTPEPVVYARPPAFRRDTSVSVGTAGSDPFGDKNAT